MVLKEEDTKKVIDFVKGEPRTVQEISKAIEKSWVTTDSYLKEIKDRTGLIDIKTFRKGTQGALKIVYYSPRDSSSTDDLKAHLSSMIMSGRVKTDFDFMELFQFVQEGKKKAIVEKGSNPNKSENKEIIKFFENAQSKIYILSGNLSFLNVENGKTKMIDIIENVLKRKVFIKIITRVNLASVNNLNKLASMIEKYPGQIEIKHSYQPLRGFLIDGKVARFRSEESPEQYKHGELEETTKIFYEIYDAEWIEWLERVFWSMFKNSIEFNQRLREIKKIYK